MQDGRGLIEFIFVILIVGIITGIFAINLIKDLNQAREVALENQLTNLRNSLELYLILEGQYPDDLRALNKKCKVVEGDSLYDRKYLEHQSQDKAGYPVDPYGCRFIYDTKTGRISSH